ncbi:MAG: helix-hairpin-helix domain-containing protein [Bacteroidetes bacterium]|nr:helix-hairpin-helix domain-containing protein [Bacteroidota bacterium]
MVLLIIGLAIVGINQYKPRARSIPLYFYRVDTVALADQKVDHNPVAELHKHEAESRKSYFNPNTASVEVLMGLGLKSKVAHTIIHYRNKGGKFYKKEDMKKIYGLSAAEYKGIEGYIQLEPKGDKKESFASNASFKNTSRAESGWTIDINKANCEEFEKLYGIGKYLAAKIVNFRTKLGGFHRIEQVGETYGLEDSTFQKFKEKLICPSPILAQLSINEASYEALEAHPYISKYLAEDIVKHREKHGKFTDMAQMLQLKNIKNDFQKIIHYLTL